MGRGGFLLRMARSHPDRAFIGVEMLKEVLAQGVRRAEAEGLENCRFVWTRIREIDTWFRPGAVAGIYLNFSDPWPKERHGKRRLTHPDCLARYRRILAPGASCNSGRTTGSFSSIPSTPSWNRTSPYAMSDWTGTATGIRQERPGRSTRRSSPSPGNPFISWRHSLAR